MVARMAPQHAPDPAPAVVRDGPDPGASGCTLVEYLRAVQPELARALEAGAAWDWRAELEAAATYRPRLAPIRRRRQPPTLPGAGRTAAPARGPVVRGYSGWRPSVQPWPR